MNPQSKKIRVLIVDDSAVIRALLSKLLSSCPDIEVVGTAPDPYVAREKLIALKPDVMTLDIEMPRMDGLSFLEKVMEYFPIPTIIVSSMSVKGSETALRALALGAFAVFEKPAIDVARTLGDVQVELIATIRQAATAKVKALRKSSAAPRTAAEAPARGSLPRTTQKVIAIASSTGGTEALKEILPRLPADAPGIVIVQHMPPVFTRTYAEHLAKICTIEVREAKDGDRVLPGLALLAPGNFHMELNRSGAHYFVSLHQQPSLHGVRPAADFLLNTVARYAGANAIGLILTGMGRDGAAGLLAMKAAGAHTFVQDEESSVVFGMPKAALELGATRLSVPLQNIADHILRQLREDQRHAG